MSFFSLTLTLLMYTTLYNNFILTLTTKTSPIKKLTLAIWNNDIAKAKEALASGADVNTPDLTDTTPLMIAVVLSTYHGDRTILDLLLDAGGNIYKKTSTGESTLDYLRKDDYGAFTAAQQVIRSELAEHLVNEIKKRSK